MKPIVIFDSEKRIIRADLACVITKSVLKKGAIAESELSFRFSNGMESRLFGKDADLEKLLQMIHEKLSAYAQ